MRKSGSNMFCIHSSSLSLMSYEVGWKGTMVNKGSTISYVHFNFLS